MKRKAKDNLAGGLLCLLTLLFSLQPILCNYVPAADYTQLWSLRVAYVAEQLSCGRFSLYGDAAFLANLGGGVFCLNSDLWYLLPGMIYFATGSLLLARACFVLFLQALTLLFCLLFFHTLCREDGAGFVGSLLYFASPLRFYWLYQRFDMTKSVLWMLLPLFGYALLKLKGKISLPPLAQAGFLCLGALSLGLMGYAEPALMAVVFGVSLMVAFLCKSAKILFAAFLGLLLAAPGCVRCGQFVLGRDFSAFNISLEKISLYGYSPADFFTIFSFRILRPGCGVALLVVLVFCLWQRMVKGVKLQPAEVFFLSGGLVFMMLSLQLFPWGTLQSLSGYLLRFFVLYECNSVFFGFGVFCLCSLGALAMAGARRTENPLFAKGLPLLVMGLLMANLLYLCNTYLYNAGAF